ncbi:MAG: SPFH domain-containing protein, partial [Geothrix sp.]|nr:SPFH domain-containing protein [Geothrix sp.]
MVLLALLLFVISALAWRWKTKVGFPLSARLAIAQWVGLTLGMLVLLASMAVIVPPGQAGIQVLFGKVNAEPLPSGLHFINPFAQVVEMEVRTRNYTMSTV